MKEMSSRMSKAVLN